MRTIIILALFALAFVVGCTQNSNCDYYDQSKKYISQSEEDCRAIKFMCVNGTKPFFSECGCGCESNGIEPESIPENTTPQNSTEIPANMTPEQEHLCTNEERKAEVCTEIYDPVCGHFDPERVQCIKFPCSEDFSNSCKACADNKIKYWERGECPQ